MQLYDSKQKINVFSLYQIQRLLESIWQNSLAGGLEHFLSTIQEKLHLTPLLFANFTSLTSIFYNTAEKSTRL